MLGNLLGERRAGALRDADVDVLVTDFDSRDLLEKRIKRREADAGAPARTVATAGVHVWQSCGNQVVRYPAHPVLAWSWRPRVFPAGADERQSSRNDSALAVYMLVDYSRIRGPKAVQYIWSERVPVGTPLSSNAGLTQVQARERHREAGPVGGAARERARRLPAALPGERDAQARGHRGAHR